MYDISICCINYIDAENNINIISGEWFRTYFPMMNKDEIHLFNKNDSEYISITYTKYEEYFIKMEHYIGITFLNEPKKVLFKTKNKSETFFYQKELKSISFKMSFLIHLKLLYKLKLIKDIDETLLFPYKNILIYNIENLLKIAELEDLDSFKIAIDNCEKVFEDIYISCMNTYEKTKKIELQEKREKVKILLEENIRITNLSQEFFKDLNKLS